MLKGDMVAYNVTEGTGSEAEAGRPRRRGWGGSGDAARGTWVSIDR